MHPAHCAARGDRLTGPPVRPDAAPAGREAAESGFSTAELLGNAALGIAALIAIWAVLQALGINVVQWIGQQLGVG
jgi:hypothetical protein